MEVFIPMESIMCVFTPADLSLSNAGEFRRQVCFIMYLA